MSSEWRSIITRSVMTAMQYLMLSFLSLPETNDSSGTILASSRSYYIASLLLHGWSRHVHAGREHDRGDQGTSVLI